MRLHIHGLRKNTGALHNCKQQAHNTSYDADVHGRTAEHRMDAACAEHTAVHLQKPDVHRVILIQTVAGRPFIRLVHDYITSQVPAEALPWDPQTWLACRCLERWMLIMGVSCHHLYPIQGQK